MLSSLPSLALLALLSHPTTLVLAQEPPSENTTVSLWLPWLQLGIPQNLEASVIQAAPDATTYLLSCPSDAISDPDTTAISALCLLDAPQTITAAPTIARASFVQEGVTQEWDCSLSTPYDPMVTAPPLGEGEEEGEEVGECEYTIRGESATLVDRTGAVLAAVQKTYGAGEISLAAVTVTAGKEEATEAATPTATEEEAAAATMAAAEAEESGQAEEGAQEEETESGVGRRDGGLVAWSTGVVALVVLVAVGL